MFESRFQTFENGVPDASQGAKLALLRARLAQDGLEGFFVPRADQHQNEYVAACDERLAWLTGFTGSAGLALVMTDRALLFVDGRYIVQAPQQVDVAQWTIISTVETSPEDWIKAHATPKARLGYDPWLHTSGQIERLTKACAQAGASLVVAKTNPIDAIWLDRPTPPCAPVHLHPSEFSGITCAEKITHIQKAIAQAKADALVVSDPHALAWAFNIRGGDVSHTPLPLGYAMIPQEGLPTIFIDPVKLSGSVGEALAACAKLKSPEDFVSALRAFGPARVMLDSTTAASAIHQVLLEASATLILGEDPIALLKAVKNETEIRGAREAHLRDGIALARFLAWLDGTQTRNDLFEIEIVEALETFRRDNGKLKDVSFPTICGSGPNGAIVHYRVTRATNRRIQPGDLLLVDSGAQYQDGTTDVTRTIAIGAPTDEMRDRFTRVLKGHIAIARSVFPAGTSGAQIDAFARQFLWQAGLDFDHGTGHGVGSYLSVHEGPARIAKTGHAALKSGMILSNEPGYYKPGAFGIRIENLVLVRNAEMSGAERAMLSFETLTLAPIDRKLIDAALLTQDECAWLNAYHDTIRNALAPHLDDSTRAWLIAATKPVATQKSP